MKTVFGLLPNVLEALIELKHHQGAAKDKIADYVKSKKSSRHRYTTSSSVNAQLQRTLKHGVENGILKMRAGKYQLGQNKNVAKYYLRSLTSSNGCNECKRRSRRRRSRSRRRRRGSRRRRGGSRRRRHSLSVSGSNHSHTDSERSKQTVAKASNPNNNKKGTDEDNGDKKGKTKRQYVRKEKSKPRSRSPARRASLRSGVKKSSPKLKEFYHNNDVGEEGNSDNGCGNSGCICNEIVKEEMSIDKL